MIRFLSTLAVLAVAIVELWAPATALAQDTDKLVSWMTGSFSSAEQAACDSNYFDIRLEMVRIWQDRGDGYWFYVEQAAATHLDRPYRQRVYHLTGPVDGAFSSEVYAIPDPKRFAGVWKDEKPLASLTPDSLNVREGCAVVLRWNKDGAFEGGTVGDGCKSVLRGASYATSQVTVQEDRIASWDRGFDESGRQVWGARKGGYVFLKITRE